MNILLSEIIMYGLAFAGVSCVRFQNIGSITQFKFEHLMEKEVGTSLIEILPPRALTDIYCGDRLEPDLHILKYNASIPN